MTMGSERFDLERVIDEATLRTGLDDFGEATWREGLALLLHDLSNEARLHELGVDIAAGEIVDYLSIRLGITDYRKHHPAIASSPIARPIVIVGQPRTGTTILYDLLAQDPRLRAPLSWEVDRPLPPPDPDTYGTDPRIAEVQSTIDLADTLIPGFTSFHPMGALHGQECVRITAGDFRSMIFNTQYRVPNYNRWLMTKAELGPAYRWHRQYLQHLQARQPAQQWLLKSPAHMWHLGALAAEYPDALIIQTHRDPLKVVASVSALVAHLRKMASDETSVAEVAPSFNEDIFLGLERTIAAREAETFPAGHVVDVRFTEFVADPLSTIRGLYDHLELELTDSVEHQMRTFLEEHPGDGGGGGARYSFANTRLDADDLRARAQPYQELFGVESEPVR
jgi:Sulfotransferase family